MEREASRETGGVWWQMKTAMMTRQRRRRMRVERRVERGRENAAQLRGRTATALKKGQVARCGRAEKAEEEDAAP